MRRNTLGVAILALTAFLVVLVVRSSPTAQASSAPSATIFCKDGKGGTTSLRPFGGVVTIKAVAKRPTSSLTCRWRGLTFSIPGFVSIGSVNGTSHGVRSLRSYIEVGLPTATSTQQASLPSGAAKAHTIAAMKVGQAGWTVPWAMWASKDQRLWLNPAYAIAGDRDGTAQLQVIRTPHGYDVRNFDPDYRWTSGLPSYYGQHDVHWIPVASFKQAR